MPEVPFPGVELRHKGGHYAVLDSGAQVLSWSPPGQNAVLWVSPVADFEPGVVVRGGVPVVFPWFGSGVSGDRSPAHGFARTAAWRRGEVVNDLSATGRLQVRHTLEETGLGSAPFSAVLDVTFAHDLLTISLTVTNTGTATFSYEEALHTYLAVADVTAIGIDGLDGCAYLDKADGAGPDEVHQDGTVRFDDEVDRVYRHTGTAVVTDPGWARTLTVGKDGSANTVVWNPGPVKGSALADVGRYWSGFVCVEAGNVRDAAISLDPGELHILTQTVEIA
ncbi:D-hexose-6-phosphate mutarotase [Propionicimonas sp.]|uniref:D-hexose-6-phosphate mutarotase n=1 Tax=Propionicimonas sp. TaxID=1955623 RepID=UPI0039E3BB3F